MFVECAVLDVSVVSGGNFNRSGSNWNTSSVPTISDFSTNAEQSLCDAIVASNLSDPLLFNHPVDWQQC